MGIIDFKNDTKYTLRIPDLTYISTFIDKNNNLEEEYSSTYVLKYEAMNKLSDK